MATRFIFLSLFLLIIANCSQIAQTSHDTESLKGKDIRVNEKIQFPHKNLGCLPTVWKPFKVDVKGNYAYIVDSIFMGTDSYTATPSGFYTVDISDRKSPQTVGRVTLTSRAWDILSVGDVTYIATSTGIQIVDTSNPSKPKLLDLITTQDDVSCLKLVEGYLFALDSVTSLHVYDIRNPASPKEIFVKQVGSVSQITQSMLIVGDHLYISDPYGKVLIYNISKPTEPVFVKVSDEHLRSSSCCVSGNYLYSGSQDYILIFDMKDLDNPKQVGDFKVKGYAMAITFKNNHLFVFSQGSFASYDISNPTSPVKIAEASLRTNIKDMCFDDNYIYTVDNVGQFSIFDFSKEIEDKGKYEPVGSIANPKNTMDFRVNGNYVYTLDLKGLAVFDISSPDNICCKSLYEFVPAVRSLDMIGNKIYVLNRTGVSKDEYSTWTSHRDKNAKASLSVIDCTDPLQLVVEASIKAPPGVDKFIVLKNKYVVVEVNNSSDWEPAPPDLYVIDISDLKNPQNKFNQKSEYFVSDWSKDDKYFYILWGNAKLSIYEIRSIESMKPVSEIELPKSSNRIEITGKMAFIGNSDFGFAKINLSNINQPVIVESVQNHIESKTLISKKELIALNGKMTDSSFVNFIIRSGLISMGEIWGLADGPAYVTDSYILGLAREEYRHIDTNMPYGTVLKSYEYSLTGQ